MYKKILLTLSALLFSVCSLAEVKVGDTFPSFKIPTLDGKMLDTAQLKGRVIYVDFWASWCTTCKKSFPIMSELSEELKSQGVFFLGINTDEDPALAQQFLESTPVSFLNVSDKTQKVVSYFAPKGFPYAYIVGKDGVVHTIKGGFAGKEETKELLLELAAR
ncbi:TlpA family protein disulfide reductase [Reinekea blandensis]|uniref:Putative electron transfer protein n=1 Tax=Reinekea blandensis MED297 TaxID=314283 RepID=A4BK70_9GAMM|nr:TlpA disulfide reductase family protein [Reinekea blandensis]EAR07499.1 putative electron transfer protein [Reinekea sp. MED297] [Reinekea blandensis MED297]